MAVEGYNPPNQAEKPKLLFDAESVKRDYEKTRREKGDRYFAYELGIQSANANAHAQLGMKDAYTVARQQAEQALLAQIRNNSELMEIYQTGRQLETEQNRIFNEYFSQGEYSGKKMTEADKKRNLAESDRLHKIVDRYEEQILAASKPATSSEQLPPLPRVCIEATRYQIKGSTVPDVHTHSCPICSGK